MIKEINFPSEEIKQLKNKSRIITTRVSREYNHYTLGDIVQTPWGKMYVVDKIEKINGIKNHPFYHELTAKQIQLISKYKKIDVLTLKKL